MKIIPIDSIYRKQADDLIKEEWAGPMIVTKGKAWDTSVLQGRN